MSFPFGDEILYILPKGVSSIIKFYYSTLYIVFAMF